MQFPWRPAGVVPIPAAWRSLMGADLRNFRGGLLEQYQFLPLGGHLWEQTHAISVAACWSSSNSCRLVVTNGSRLTQITVAACWSSSNSCRFVVTNGSRLTHFPWPPAGVVPTPATWWSIMATDLPNFRGGLLEQLQFLPLRGQHRVDICQFQPSA